MNLVKTERDEMPIRNRRRGCYAKIVVLAEKVTEEETKEDVKVECD